MYNTRIFIIHIYFISYYQETTCIDMLETVSLTLTWQTFWNVFFLIPVQNIKTEWGFFFVIFFLLSNASCLAKSNFVIEIRCICLLNVFLVVYGWQVNSGKHDTQVKSVRYSPFNTVGQDSTKIIYCLPVKLCCVHLDIFSLLLYRPVPEYLLIKNPPDKRVF